MRDTSGPVSYVELLDWRRRVLALYAEVRDALRTDPLDAHERWRRGRDALFREHPQSPLPPSERASFAGLPYFPYDPDLAFTARIDTDVPEERFLVGTSTGEQMAFVRVGRVDLAVGRLDVYWLDAYGGGLFLPLRDATAGVTTYGGGRYVLDTAKGADLGSTPDGRLNLDLNFTYHPSCRYDPRWACPLAPPGNRLEAAIPAGERL